MKIKIKKTFSIFLILVMVFSVIPGTAYSNDETIDPGDETPLVEIVEEEEDFELEVFFQASSGIPVVLDHLNSTISSAGLITWWGGSAATDTNIIIPKQINGITVTGIADRVFMGKGLVSVTFEPDIALNTIGKQAFQGNLLTELSVPPSVTVIGEAAFAFNNITQLELVSGIETLDINAFRNNALINVTLPSTLKTIASGAFMLNPGLSSINLDSVTKIGNEAFFGCSFDTVILPAGLLEYGEKVFAFNQRYVLVSGSSLARTYSSAGQFGEIAGIIRTLTVRYQDETGKNLLSEKIYTTNRTVQAESTASLVVDGNTVTVPVPAISGFRATGGDPEVRYVSIDGNRTYIIVYTPDNKAPVFSGLTDIVISVGGAEPDLLDGVTAKNGKGDDITHLIKVTKPSGWFDSSSVRSYIVTYSVTDPDDWALKRTEYRSVLIGSNPMLMEVGFGWLYEDFMYSSDGKTLLGLSSYGQIKYNAGNTALMLPDRCPVAENGERNVPVERIADGLAAAPTFPQDFTYISFVRMKDLKHIGNYAFGSEVITVSNTRTVLSGSRGMTLVGLSGCDKLASIGDFAFSRMKLSDLDLSGCSALETIGVSAFEMSQLSVLDISGCFRLRDIENNAFRNARLAELNLRGCTRLEIIGEYSFYMSPIALLDLSMNTELREIKTAAFSSAPLTKLDFSNNLKLKIIGVAAFSGARLFDTRSSITTVSQRGLILNSSIEEIRAQAFNFAPYDWNLTENWHVIDNVDFSVCTSLKYIGSYAFGYSEWCFYYDGIDWVGYPVDLSGCVSLEKVDDYAFGNAYPSTVILTGTKNLKYIGTYAFGYFWMENPVEIDLSDCVSLEYIGSYAFSDIPFYGLDLTASVNLKEIGHGAFAYNAKAHPAISREGELLITYNVNSMDNEMRIFRFGGIYHPRFVRVKVEEF